MVEPDPACKRAMEQIAELRGHTCVKERMPNGEEYCADCMRLQIAVMDYNRAVKAVLGR